MLYLFSDLPPILPLFYGPIELNISMRTWVMLLSPRSMTQSSRRESPPRHHALPWSVARFWLVTPNISKHISHHMSFCFRMHNILWHKCRHAIRPIHDTVFAWPLFPDSWYPHHPCCAVGRGAVLDDDYLLLPMLLLMPIVLLRLRRGSDAATVPIGGAIAMQHRNINTCRWSVVRIGHASSDEEIHTEHHKICLLFVLRGRRRMATSQSPTGACLLILNMSHKIACSWFLISCDAGIRKSALLTLPSLLMFDPFHLEIQPRRRICSGHQSQFSWVRPGVSKVAGPCRTQNPSLSYLCQRLAVLDTYWHSLAHSTHSII